MRNQSANQKCFCTIAKNCNLFSATPTAATASAHARGTMRISPLLLATTCASLRTPFATMGVVSKAGKLFGQFRQKRDVKDVSKLIKPGDMLPEAIVEVSADGRQMPLAEVMAASKGMSLLVGMPGAFTPTCSSCHLPSLVEAAPRLDKARQPRLLDLACSSLDPDSSFA